MTGLDWVLTTALILFAWNGYRVGLVKQLFRVVGVFLSYLVAKTYAPLLSPYLIQYIPTLHPKAETPLLGIQGTGASDLYIYSNTIKQSATNSLQQVAAGSLGYALSFALLFLITYIVIRVAATFMNGIASLPILSFFNKTIGALAGVVFVVILESVVLHILMILPFPTAHQWIGSSGLAHSLLDIHLGSWGHKLPISTNVF